MFFIDTIKILPNDIDCYIAYSNKDNVVVSFMEDTSDPNFDKCIRINDFNRKILIRKFQKLTIVEYFNAVEIRKNSNLFFRGYDDIGGGLFSKDIDITNWFIEKYKINWDYSISDKW